MSKRSFLQSQPLALCFEEGAVPDWVQLTPQGPRLPSRDGREWQLPDPDAVVRAYEASLAAGVEAPVDFEHATHVKGERGERADAVGWVKEIANRDGSLWGRIDWTETGRAAVASRGYRYVSPGFFFSAATRAVARLASVGLTNLPNFALPALNRDHPEPENDPMDPAVLEALGLNPTANAAEAVLAINNLKSAEALALNRAATPDPEKFVPKADHQLALNRIAGFEVEEKTRVEKAASDAVDAAITAGKIAPAIGQTVRAISDWVAAHPGLARALGYTIAALGAIRLLMTPVTGAWRLFSAVARGLGTVVGLAARAIMGLGRVALVTGRMMLANPILAVIAAIATAAYLIYRNWDTVGPWFRRLWDNVRAVFAGFMEFVTGIFTGDLGRAFDGFKQMGDGLLGYWRTVWDGVVGVFTWAWAEGIAPVLDALGLLDPILAAWQAFKDGIGVVLDWISAKFAGLMTVIQPVLDGLKWVQDKGAAVFNSMNGNRDGPISSGPYTGGATGPILPPAAVPGVTVPARALGGPVRAGQIYRWQEEGHELFVPRSDGQVISNRQLRAMQSMAEAPSSLRIVEAAPRSVAAGGAAGGGMRLDLGGITINAAPGMDPQAVARAVRREIEALTRERGFALHDGGDYA